MGLVGLWDCVTFDEVAGMNFKDANAVQILKDYMASRYARGAYTERRCHRAGGNINDSVQNVLKTRTCSIPSRPSSTTIVPFRRIHCYLPGGRFPRCARIADGHYGLITDCLSEFCKEMRRKDFTHLIDRHFRLNSTSTSATRSPCAKPSAAWRSFCFPTGATKEVRRLLEYAIEGRRRVKEQLKIMAGVEFIDVGLGYYDVDDPTDARVVGVPEQSDGALIPTAQLLPGHVFGIAFGGKRGMRRVQAENRAAWRFPSADRGLGGYKAVKEAIKAAWYFENNAARWPPACISTRRTTCCSSTTCRGVPPTRCPWPSSWACARRRPTGPSRRRS
ncbi:MAG: BREX system Lon protease-like protein BrxL [Adlercreutzia equolifaciens]